jgi:hypothetical protein
MIEKRLDGKAYSRALKQEEIDLLILKNPNLSDEDEAINNIFNKFEIASSNKHDYSNSSPFLVEQKAITYLKENFIELLHCLPYQFKSKCTMELITVENITISEFRTLLTSDSYLATIKSNISSVPIRVHASGSFGNEKEILREFLDFTAKNLNRIIPDFNTTNMIISREIHEALNENYSTILISFSIEFANDEKGFLMLNLPHDFLKYLP